MTRWLGFVPNLNRAVEEERNSSAKASIPLRPLSLAGRSTQVLAGAACVVVVVSITGSEATPAQPPQAAMRSPSTSAMQPHSAPWAKPRLALCEDVPLFCDC
jgi:hypothetical protein